MILMTFLISSARIFASGELRQSLMFTRLSLRKNNFKTHKIVSTVQSRKMNFASTQYAEKIAAVRTCGYAQPDFDDLR